MTIKANELRIGNWVILSEDMTKFIIEEISKTGLVVQNSQETAWIEIEEFEPIPLTEEILLKCGFFDENNIWFIKELGSLSIEISIKVGKISIWGRFNEEHEIEGIYLPIPKSLHQLQNLYFALTGEELEIQL